MFVTSRFSKYIAVSALVMVPAAIALFWTVSTGFTFAGDSRAPRAISFSTLGHGAFLGVELEEEIEYPEGGARIDRVVDGSAADEAGLEENDIIVGIDGRTIRGPRALTEELRDREPGDEISLNVVRDGRESTFDVELGERAGAHAFSIGSGSFAVAPGAHIFNCDDDDCNFSYSWNCDGDDCENISFNSSRFGFGGRPMLGVQLVHVTDELREHMGGEEGTGVLVSKVLSGTPAEDAGIEVGDLIVAVDGEEIENHGDIAEALSDLEGETFDVQVIRNGRSATIGVTIPERDDSRPTGPRALFFTPNIEFKGLDGQVQDALDQAREALEQSRTMFDDVMRQVHAVRGDSMSDARKAYREALRQSRPSQRSTGRELREAVRKSLERRNSI
jgi:predicted metalloprotease with PDZ domain